MSAAADEPDDLACRIRPRGDLAALDGYHSPQLDVAVRLNTNECPFPPPAGFVERWTAALRDVALHRYPERDAGRLRHALGAAIGQDAGRILVANGSNEVLQTLLLTYGGAQRRALVFEPTYALHSHVARITGTEVVSVERRADFTVDPDAAAAAIRETSPAVVFLCDPNNPTGTVEPRSTLEHLAEVAAAHGALLVVDEAYGEFSTRSALDLVADERPVVVVRTYSKVWSLAAVRLGYAVAPRWVVAELEQVVLPYHLSVATQLAGVLALDHVTEMRDRVATLVAERTRLVAALEERPGVEPFPSGANFVLFRAPGDGRQLWEALVARGILVRDCSQWPRTEGCLRVTVGTEDENDRFLAALGEAIEETAA